MKFEYPRTKITFVGYLPPMKTKFYAVLMIGLLSQACNLSAGSDKSKDQGASPQSADGGFETPQSRDAKAKCDATPKSSTDIRYVYSETVNGNSCTTGCQIFNSFASYCAGLQDNNLNQNCATSQRSDAYDSICRH